MHQTWTKTIAVAIAVSGGLAGTAAAASAANNPGTGDTGSFTFLPVTPAAGAQVNVASGDLLATSHDLADSTANYHVVVDRFYNSLDSSQRRALGPRWRFSVGPDVSLADHGATVDLSGPSGYTVTLTGTGGGAYSAPAGFDGTLTRTGSGWTLARPTEHDSFLFDNSGQLTGTTDSASRPFTVQLTSAAGNTILGSYGTPDGRRANLSYNGDSAVRELDDPASGHHIYGYTAYGTGNLNSYDDGSGHHTSYGYDDNGRLNQITAPDGTDVVIRTGTDGRVAAITTQAPGGRARRTRFAYGDHTTRVTGPAGHVTIYTWDDDYRVTGTQAGTVTPAAEGTR